MNVRWKEHEYILVTSLAAIKAAGYVWNKLNLTPEKIEVLYAAPFLKNNIPFNFNRNILIPQIAQVLLMYFSYLVIMRFIVPSLKGFQRNDSVGVFFKRAGWGVCLILIISYLLALGINVVSYYAHPQFFNYGGAGFHILAYFGPNERPLQDMFTGFGRASSIVAIITLYGYLREIAIQYIEKPDQRRSYRILIANQLTAILVVYFSIAQIIIAIFNADPQYQYSIFTIYFSFIPATILVFFSNIYWLFPLKQDVFSSYLRVVTSSSRYKFQISVPFVLRLLLSTFIFVFPFAFAFRYQGEFANNLLLVWLVEVFVVSPISWLYFQQRKDKILQLRGVEKELIKSKTEMQFLRSQINPHFLFNALNTLYGTALIEKSKLTAEGIQKLGDMMRFMLHQNNLDFIPMSNEIEYLRNYISLQKLRTKQSSEITVELHIDDASCIHDIAPMLLIPFVENAFKHGISLTESSWIKIKLDCDKDLIRFEVRNSIHTLQNTDPERDNSGLGLHNVQERLKLMYHNRHQLYCEAVGNEFIAQLSIQP